MAEPSHVIREVNEFKVDPSADGDWILLNFRERDGSVLTLKLRTNIVAEWLRQTLLAVTRIGVKAPRRDEKAVISPNELCVAVPIEVCLDQQDSEPIVVMDYRVAALGFAVDRESLTHVLTQLLTRYPVEPPDMRH